MQPPRRGMHPPCLSGPRPHRLEVILDHVVGDIRAELPGLDVGGAVVQARPNPGVDELV
jgi:hypothetical protein